VKKKPTKTFDRKKAPAPKRVKGKPPQTQNPFTRNKKKSGCKGIQSGKQRVTKLLQNMSQEWKKVKKKSEKGGNQGGRASQEATGANVMWFAAG